MYRFCFVLLCIWGQFFQVQAPGGLYLEGRLNGGFFALPVWGGLYLEGLIHGGAYFRNFTVSKYRATRGNWSELALVRKSPQCHVNKFDYISGAPWVSKSTRPEKLEMFTLTLSSYFGSPGSPWENWLHINIVINWQLSKQGIRWPVSPDRIYPGRVFFWSYPLTSY